MPPASTLRLRVRCLLAAACFSLAGCSSSTTDNAASSAGIGNAAATASATTGGTSTNASTKSSSASGGNGASPASNAGRSGFTDLGASGASSTDPAEPGGSGSTGTAGGSSAKVSQGGASVSVGGRSASTGTSAAGKASVGGAAGGQSSLASAGGKPATAGTSATGGKSAAGAASAAAGKSSTGGSVTGGASNIGGATATAHCSNALPALAKAVDVTNATSVVGAGTAQSCTFSALNAAVTKGGSIRFDCGEGPVSIAVTATMKPPTDKDTVIDGGGLVMLDGGGTVRILEFYHGDFRANSTRLTLQHLKLINGKATPSEKIPDAAPPCSQGWNDGEGGALFMRDGNLTVIDCTFSNNQAAPLGPDTGGGAIYILGSKQGALIVGSVFLNNSASNAGAVGGLFAELDIYNSVFRGNKATGNGANNNDPSKCSAINNDQNEVGSGGNGGAIYQDGGSATNIVLCGVEVTGNAAGSGAFGGGVFMTSNDWSGTLTILDSTITGNTGGSWTQVHEGSVANVGSAFGVNALSISVRNSTLQDVK